MMTKQLWMLMVACALCGVLVACGDDGESDGGGDGDAAGDGDGDGDGGGAWEVDEPLNVDCPQSVPPFDGPGAEHGACCFRGEPNSVRQDAYDADANSSGMAQLSYRFNYNTSIRPEATLGNSVIQGLAKTRNENLEQLLMIRFTFPREGGENVAGMGTVEVGSGTYNCDGTYSFYGKGASPIIDGAVYPGADSGDRWERRSVPAMFDPEETGTDRFKIAFEDEFKGFAYTSFVETTTAPGEFTLDWEIVTQAFDLLDFDYDPEEINCLGSRDGDTYIPGGQFEFYADLPNNNDPNNGISTLNGINFCTLVSFGIGGTPDLNCETDERCLPGSSDDCKWKALPDSLCPSTDEEKAIFGCHVGDEGNVNNDNTQVVNCTQEAPTEYSEDSDGQCCDPLGQSATLPACNAFRVLQDIVATSAVITEDFATEELQACAAE